ncbi:MAG: phosphotransferase [Solirubrobacterales bacterium]|nr:phosphotransferase [Solirubrobacterales bacterium]
MPATDVPVVRHPDELTTAWLEQALGTGPIAGFALERVGTGQMSQSFRVTLEHDGAPASVVAKFAASDPTSRATGVGLGAYEREVRFYRELAPRLGGPLPACHAAVLDPEEGWFTLLLEDVAPAAQGDQIAGCAVEEARLAMRELARLHAPVFADPELGATPWLNQEMPLNQALLSQLLPAFLERYGDGVAPEHREVCERFVASLDGWVADRRPPLGLVHGDFRLDNVLYGGPGSPRPFTVVDWQTVGWGPAMLDACYFLGGGLPLELRREHEEELVREYHAALLAEGVRGFAWEACWDEYRRMCFHGLLMAIAPAMIVERTERGDRMFMTTLARHAQQALDLGALDLLPAPGAGRPPALRPDPADEGRHAPGPEELWNESWYFDAVTEDGALGVWARLGLYPNLGVSWVHAFVCRPGRPTAGLIEFAAPLPAGDAVAVDDGGVRARLDCEAALERFRVVVEGTAEAFADDAAPLRAERGTPTPLALDLTWETRGDPYAYRVATRYEIPCLVRGTVRVGDEELELRAVGQRDHSWGTRDWWSAEWVWSAAHLTDGTRLHGVEFRLPGTPAIGLGYAQPPEGGVEELDVVRAREDVGDDGLIAGGRVLAVEPLAFGALRLVAPDGRVTSFPRAMCRFVGADGARGVGWVEWNRNVDLAG